MCLVGIDFLLGHFKNIHWSNEFLDRRDCLINFLLEYDQQIVLFVDLVIFQSQGISKYASLASFPIK